MAEEDFKLDGGGRLQASRRSLRSLPFSEPAGMRWRVHARKQKRDTETGSDKKREYRDVTREQRARHSRKQKRDTETGALTRKQASEASGSRTPSKEASAASEAHTHTGARHTHTREKSERSERITHTKKRSERSERGAHTHGEKASEASESRTRRGALPHLPLPFVTAFCIFQYMHSKHLIARWARLGVDPLRQRLAWVLILFARGSP